MLPKIYEDLFKLPGISGHEDKVRDYYLKYLQKFDDFEIITDNLGSVLATKIKKSKC